MALGGLKLSQHLVHCGHVVSCWTCLFILASILIISFLSPLSSLRTPYSRSVLVMDWAWSTFLSQLVVTSALTSSLPSLFRILVWRSSWWDRKDDQPDWILKR